MRERLREGGFEGPGRLRKPTVEPGFGQIKHARGFRQLPMRGLAKVSGEWAMICTAHNPLEPRPRRLKPGHEQHARFRPYPIARAGS